MVSVFTVNSLLGGQSGQWGTYSYLVRFNNSTERDTLYEWFDLCIFLIYGRPQCSAAAVVQCCVAVPLQVWWGA